MQIPDYREVETSRAQRQLVDTCFEEGLYESGIAVLDQMRSQHVKPAPAHIRQLILIAMYPPPDPELASSKAKGKQKQDNPFGSPTKSPSKSPTKSPIKRSLKASDGPRLPSPASSQAALNLLTAYALTNSPGALLRAVPCYPLRTCEVPDESAEWLRGVGMGPDAVKIAEEDDAPIAKQAHVLEQCADCWALLAPGIVKRLDEEAAKKKEAAINLGLGDDEDEDEDADAGNDDYAYVDEHAWPILAWLIRLFESEKAIAAQHGHEPYSLSLLTHFRPSGGETSARTDFTSVLDVIFECYRQVEPARRRMGACLMSLLINLTRSQYCSASQLINHIAYKLPHFSNDALHELLADLPSDPRATAFKAVICERFLFDKLKGKSSTLAPRPQARRARPLQAAASLDGTSTSGRGTPQAKQASQYPWAMPATSRVVGYFPQEPRPHEKLIPNCIAKFHLFTSFAMYKRRDRDDREWRQFIDGHDIALRLTRALNPERAAGGEENAAWVLKIGDMKATLLDMMDVLRLSEDAGQ